MNNPEQIKQEQERVQTLLEECECCGQTGVVCGGPCHECRRKPGEIALARAYLTLLDAHLALHAQLAQAEGREKVLREAIGVYITHVYACLGIDDDKMVSTFTEALNGGPQ